MAIVGRMSDVGKLSEFRVELTKGCAKNMLINGSSRNR